jgi:hypothetical protein
MEDEVLVEKNLTDVLGRILEGCPISKMSMTRALVPFVDEFKCK